MAFDQSKPYAKEGYDLMAALFEVHRYLGGGLLEEVYQQSSAIEFGIQNIPYQAKPKLPVFYKESKLDTSYQPDFIVFDKIVVELKAVSALIPEHEAQLLNYMRITRIPVGYLVNMAPIGKAEWKRFVLSEYL